jgi:hypothetical protein
MAQTRLSLNKVISEFKQFALDHKMINDFGVGDPWDLAASKQVTYPVMWCTFMPSNMTPSNQRSGNATLKLKMAIIFGDLTQKDESDQTEVWSDQMGVALDFFAWYYQYFQDLDIDAGATTLVPFTESMDDQITGWTMQATIDLPLSSAAWSNVPK